MKAYLVIRKFNDTHAEGVMFTNEQDAEDALHGVSQGSSLAREWTDIYGGDPMKMIEIDVDL